MAYVLKGLFLFLLVALPAGAADQKALVVGLHPNVNPVTVLTLYQPVRVFLEQELKRPVQLETAPNFPAYINRTLGGEFDIAVTAPHLARLAQTKKNFVPLFNYADELRAIVIVGKGSPFRKVEDLHGKTVAIPDRLTIISIMGTQFLRDKNLIPDTHVKIFLARSHNNAALSVEKGESDAAIIGSVPFKQLSAELRGKLRLIAQTDAVPNQFIIANPRLAKDEIERIKAALINFEKTPEGKNFLTANGFGAFKAPSQALLKKLDPYAREVEALLAKQSK